MIRTALFAAALLAPLPALAASIDFTQPLIGLDHKPLSDCKEMGSDGKTCARSGPITLGEVSAAGLSIPDRNASVDDQVKRGRLAQKVIDGKAVDLTVEEAKMIKDQVGKLGTQPTIVFDVVKIIDPASVK